MGRNSQYGSLKDLLYVIIFGVVVGLLLGCVSVNVNTTDWSTLKPQDFPPLVVEGVNIPYPPDLPREDFYSVNVKGQYRSWKYEEEEVIDYNGDKVLDFRRTVTAKFSNAPGWTVWVEVKWQEFITRGDRSYYGKPVAWRVENYALTPVGWVSDESYGVLVSIYVPTTDGWGYYPRTPVKKAAEIIDTALKSYLQTKQKP